MINKRGQGLSMETIIIAILVLVVLVFVIIFFTGGFSSLSSKIKETMFGTATGQDKAIAIQNCQSYCEQASSFGNNQQLIRSSAYCTKWFKIDYNNDGSADKFPDTDSEKAGQYKHFYCSDKHVTENPDYAATENLGVACGAIQSC